MRRIKGNIESFAIESEITKSTPYLMGHLCLWIGGIQVGAYEDEVMLLCVKASLDQIVKGMDQQQNLDFVKMKTEDLFALIYSGDIDNGQYLLHVAESFDDFSFFTFAANDEIHFVWKLRDDPFFSYPNYPKGVIHKTVKISEFTSVVQDKELWQPE